MSSPRFAALVAAAQAFREWLEAADLAFDMCYDSSGELKFAQMLILRSGKDYLAGQLEIERILDKIPEKKFYIRKKAKAYAAGIGDMNDLLENPVEIGNVNEILGRGKKWRKLQRSRSRYFA